MLIFLRIRYLLS